MNELLEIERIRSLKARYFRCLDTNDWPNFASTMTETCSARYNSGKLSFDKRDDIVEFMRSNLSGENVLTLHHGHHPEIELIDENTARGKWYLEDTVLHLESGMRIYGSGIYDDKYCKQDGQWMICATGYQRVFEAMEPLPEGHQVTQSMFREG